ncbi:helix-turn-helix domain-containing protein [Skermania sp. ID1734]|uniref:helix-turn-helix domain-containing protein n=1 Tax=Skermania sp. ID1734 TaxID=2597516 RepID=UPI00117F3C8D|nr:helix-turn-helix domain-containing protein [Skermania sp. ID1734]TSD99965.1 helix-turn-helix domain-containing protein [Skermania sp. ID1734]
MARLPIELDIADAASWPELMTPPETAAATRQSLRKLASDRALGRGIPFLKLGGAVRYRKTAVLAYFEEAAA